MNAPEMPDSEFLYDEELVINEAVVEEQRLLRNVIAEIDAELKLAGNRNRIQLRTKSVEYERIGPLQLRALVALEIGALAGMNCRFSWAQISLNFAFTTGAKIFDYSPKRAGDNEIEFRNQFNSEGKAGIPAVVDTSLATERETKYTASFPDVAATKISEEVTWSFKAPTANHELRLDYPLLLAVDFPTGSRVLAAGVTIEALISRQGYSGLLPVVGKRAGSKHVIARIE